MLESRIKEEDADRLEREKLEFHQKVYAGYEEIEKIYDRIVGIDATGTIEEISVQIRSHIDRVLNEK